MHIEVGDIIYAHNKRLLVVRDPHVIEFPFLLIDLDNFEVNNAWTTLESISNSFKIDKALNSYQITLSK